MVGVNVDLEIEWPAALLLPPESLAEPGDFFPLDDPRVAGEVHSRELPSPSQELTRRTGWQTKRCVDGLDQPHDRVEVHVRCGACSISRWAFDRHTLLMDRSGGPGPSLRPTGLERRRGRCRHRPTVSSRPVLTVRRTCASLHANAVSAPTCSPKSHRQGTEEVLPFRRVPNRHRWRALATLNASTAPSTVSALATPDRARSCRT